MEKKDLIITIAGKTMNGKSRITYLLKKFLREQGFEVVFEGNLDHPTESNFDRHMCMDIDEAVERIKETITITLKEEQLSSNFKNNV